MRKTMSPAAIVGIAIAVVLGIGLLGWKLISSSSSEPQAVVKVANPDDPKFRPDPKIGVTSGGGSAPQGNSSD